MVWFGMFPYLTSVKEASKEWDGLLWWLSGKKSVCNAGDAVQSLDQEDLEEKEMATYSSVLTWEIPWTEEPDRLQLSGSQKVGRDLVTGTMKQWRILKDVVPQTIKYSQLYLKIKYQKVVLRKITFWKWESLELKKKHFMINNNRNYKQYW